MTDEQIWDICFNNKVPSGCVTPELTFAISEAVEKGSIGFAEWLEKDHYYDDENDFYVDKWQSHRDAKYLYQQYIKTLTK